MVQKENICPAGTARVDKEILMFGHGRLFESLFQCLFCSGDQEIAAVELSTATSLCGLASAAIAR